MSVRRILPWAVLPGALALHVASASAPHVVQWVYAERVYPVLVSALEKLFGAVRFAAWEWLVTAVVLILSAVAVRHIRRARAGGLGWVRVLLGLSKGFFGLLGCLYVGFLLLWGLNHQRPSFAELAGLATPPVAVEELRELSLDLVAAVNVARQGLAEDEHGVMRLAGGLGAAMSRAGLGFAPLAQALGPGILVGPVTRPKLPRVSAWMWRVGISGIYIPFTAEPNVNATLPDPDVPFTACHELAHLAGFAREDEASYVGYSACLLHPDADFRYSAQFVASLHAMSALASVDRVAYDELALRRSAGVTRDVEAIRRWSLRYAGAVQRTANRVNDAYLKSQGHADGVRSYGRLVDLLVAERNKRQNHHR
jgi:hypothetical protein